LTVCWQQMKWCRLLAGQQQQQQQLHNPRYAVSPYLHCSSHVLICWCCTAAQWQAACTVRHCGLVAAPGTSLLCLLNAFVAMSGFRLLLLPFLAAISRARCRGP
jgi:hypothetical protein